eukprot:114767-Hanusia_phi.AAC.2
MLTGFSQSPHVDLRRHLHHSASVFRKQTTAISRTTSERTTCKDGQASERDWVTGGWKTIKTTKHAGAHENVLR